MTVIDGAVAPAEMAGVEAISVEAALEDYLGEPVTDWDALNVHIVHKDGRQLGGFMRVYVTTTTNESTGPAEIEIDNSRRPLPEDVITALGKLAQWNETGDSQSLFVGPHTKTPRYRELIICSDDSGYLKNLLPG